MALTLHYYPSNASLTPHLLLRELGYGVSASRPADGDWPAFFAAFDTVGKQLERYLLAERRSDVMAARAMLRRRLARIEGS